MKAIECTQYGGPDVLQLTEIEKPTPKGNEVLIKVHAASVTAADGMMRRGVPVIGRLFLGLFKPKNSITGTGFSGEVEAIGQEVKNYKVGDHVFGETGLGFGANAEYVCVVEDGVLAKKPSVMSFEEAAPICDGPLTSMNFLENLANLQNGQSILINGASGSLGMAAIQLAKCFGGEVTGVCSTSNLEQVRSLGADQVIDYTKEDFTKNSKTYDVIYDTVGKSSFSSCKNSLTAKGAYISPVLGMSLLFQMLWTSKVGSKKAKFSATGVVPPPELRILLKKIIKLIEEKKITTIIDKRYTLDQTAEAHRYVETGHKKGNVVVTIP